MHTSAHAARETVAASCPVWQRWRPMGRLVLHHCVLFRSTRVSLFASLLSPASARPCSLTVIHTRHDTDGTIHYLMRETGAWAVTSSFREDGVLDGKDRESTDHENALFFCTRRVNPEHGTAHATVPANLPGFLAFTSRLGVRPWHWYSLSRAGHASLFLCASQRVLGRTAPAGSLCTSQSDVCWIKLGCPARAHHSGSGCDCRGRRCHAECDS